MTRPALAALVAREAMLALAVALAAVGVGTAALLHVRGVRAVDALLLAAAHEAAHAPAEGDWEVEHSRSPVAVRLLAPDEGGEAADRARRRERPVTVDRDDERVLYLPVHPDDDGDDEDDDRLVVVEARADRPTAARTVGPFVVAYLAVAGSLGVGSAVLLRRRLARALAPLAVATAAVARVDRLDAGQRLGVDGPAEVAALLAATNALLDRLETAARAQSRFTAEAAHELRTPLTVLRGELDVALRRPRDPEAYRAVLASVGEEVDRLRELVEGLLAIARVDSGQAAENREPAALDELVREAVRAERAEGVEVRVGRSAVVRVHRPLLVIALGNLVRNARRHGRPPVWVEVDEGTVRVHDAGPGVAEADRERVFDRFVRGPTARRDDAGGLGLGLPLARAIARAHGGDCRAVDGAVELTVPVDGAATPGSR